MARSDPSLVDARIPTEAQPDNRFTFTATVRQGGPDPWGSDNSCVTQRLDVTGWQTPVKLFVDGEEVDSTELCLAPDNTKDASLGTSLSPGTHELKVAVYEVGGNAYDLSDDPMTENDAQTQTVTVEEGARDPSEPTATDRVTEFLASIAEALGGTTQQVAFGMVLAAVLILVV
jgi:hypothetical protein